MNVDELFPEINLAAIKGPGTSMAQLAEEMDKAAEEMKRAADMSLEEIKRRLKYAKNPMEIKELNRKLTKAYKEKGKIRYEKKTHSEREKRDI